MSIPRHNILPIVGVAWKLFRQNVAFQPVVGAELEKIRARPRPSSVLNWKIGLVDVGMTGSNATRVCMQWDPCEKSGTISPGNCRTLHCEVAWRQKYVVISVLYRQPWEMSRSLQISYIYWFPSPVLNTARPKLWKEHMPKTQKNQAAHLKLNADTLRGKRAQIPPY